jgi:hypothetical protein
LLDKIFFASKYISIKGELAKFEIKISGSQNRLQPLNNGTLAYTMLEKTTKLVPDGTSQSGFWDRAPFLQQSCFNNRQIVFDVL